MRHLAPWLCLVLLSGCARGPLLAPETPSLDSDPAPQTFVLDSVRDPRLPIFESGPVADAVGPIAADAASGHFADPASAWNGLVTQLASEARLPPPAFARAYALAHVAIHDALAAGRFARGGHLPEPALAAGAAATVLRDLFPAASARIDALAAAQRALGNPSVFAERAWRLGTSVGDLVVDHAHRDGSGAVFAGPMPSGAGIWTGTNPVLPMCGTWSCWIVPSGDERFQAEPPYAFGSPEDLADVAAVVSAASQRTPEQIAIVHKWGDRSPPAIWNGLLVDRIGRDRLRPAAAARALAYLNVAIYDAFVCCWKTKYTHWTARPVQRSPGLVTVIATPNFPSYTSGHSTISAAASLVMSEVFPRERDFFANQASEAAMSRLWGGIHFPHDNDEGLRMGRLIGAEVVRRMNNDQGAKLVAFD